jgi:amyloid beta precursor protein binding protein 1
VCLLGATGLGAEALKNLVLPGIGSFTIVDGAKVTSSDLGNNFFVTEEDVGRSRAQVTNLL